MTDDGLQVENGHYTRIVNPLIENLIKIPFKGCELAVAMYIIRKTYGFQKKEDQISLTQFQEGLGRSRQTIVTALKNLQLVEIARLVKQGNAKGACNIWTINKYHTTWKLVNMARLVQRKRGTSLTEAPNLVYTARHTKEIQKKVTKETSDVPSQEVVTIIDSFKEVNPSYGVWYANKTQRAAISRLLDTHGLERLQKVIAFLPQSNTIPYVPTITSPYILEQKWADLEAGLRKVKNKSLINQPKVII